MTAPAQAGAIHFKEHAMNRPNADGGSGERGLLLQGPIRLVCANSKCWKCGSGTPVVALAPAGIRDTDDDDAGHSQEGSLVYNIPEDGMPESLQLALARHAPLYVPTYSGTMGEVIWANRCAACNAIQGAFYLHCEPDGAFFDHRDSSNCTYLDLVDGDVMVSEADYSI